MNSSMVLHWGVGHLGSWCWGAMTYALKSVPHKLLKHRDMEKMKHWAASTHTVPSLSLYGSLLRPGLSREKHSLGDGDAAGLVFSIQQCRLVGQWRACQDAYCACIAEALPFAQYLAPRHQTTKPSVEFTGSLQACSILGMRKWARLTGHGPASELLNTGPELVQGAGYNEAVDWWALGCVLFGLCSRKQLFPGKAHEVFSAIAIFDPSSPNSFSGYHCMQWGRWSACVLQSLKLGSARQESGSTLGMKGLDGRRQSQTAWDVSARPCYSKAYYNCSCFFSSLWPKCFCRLFQSATNSEWRGNCQCGGKVSSEGLLKTWLTRRMFHQQAARRSAAKKWKASCKLWAILESTEPDPKKFLN